MITSTTGVPSSPPPEMPPLAILSRRASCTDLRGWYAAGGWLAAECGVAAVVIVGVQPDPEASAQRSRRCGRAGRLGPLVGQGAVEPLRPCRWSAAGRSRAAVLDVTEAAIAHWRRTE